MSSFASTCSRAKPYFHVVTSENTARLPSVPALGLIPTPGSSCSWHVDVHGSYATFDKAAGEGGVVHPCRYRIFCSPGSLREKGTVTISEWRDLTLAEIIHR